MNVVLPTPGKYIVAVSGGVDSMVLLNRLRQEPGLELVVAHLDHGIRKDSTQDQRLVQIMAEKYALPFVYEAAQLGADVSEAQARQVRYDFLRRAQQGQKARAVITAHHRDDVLETAIINILRGTGRKGLASLSSQDGLERPLLQVPKVEIIAYARQQELQWREDSTNRNTDYLRNYVRHQLLPRFDIVAKEQLWNIISQTRQTNAELDTLLAKYIQSHTGSTTLNRLWFNTLPHQVAREIMAAWWRSQGLHDFDRAAIERLVVAAKVATPGKAFDILQGVKMIVGKDTLALAMPER